MVLKTNEQKAHVGGLPTERELQDARALEGISPARAALMQLFDEDTFVETGAYMTRGFGDYVSCGHENALEGVITGYGAVNGDLVFAFAQDETRMMGAIDENHAKKIMDLYTLALRKGAPVVGMFASSGAFVAEGVKALASYGKLLKVVSDASNEIVQGAYILGNCVGTSAALAASFDFVVSNNDVAYYVTNPELGGAPIGSDTITFKGTQEQCLGYIRSLLDYLPTEELECVDTQDDINRRLEGMQDAGAIDILSAISDMGQYLEITAEYGKELITALTTIAGVKCGVIVGNYEIGDGRITSDGASKVASFLSLCNAYTLPVVTLVDSCGLATDVCANSLCDLAYAYASLDVPAVTVILQHAIGASFALLGSKSLGADLVYTIENAEIGVLAADASVAFAWNDQVDLSVSREELEQKWRSSISTAAAAVATGEVDDIITMTEIRARIASALLMLTC